MDVYNQIVERIIKSQESIIGPIAVEQADQVANLKVDWDKHEVIISGDANKVVDDLVEKYKALFGRVSVEVCREAAAPFLSKLPTGQMPKTLA